MSKPCEYDTLHGRRDFVDIKFLDMGELSWIITTNSYKRASHREVGRHYAAAFKDGGSGHKPRSPSSFRKLEKINGKDPIIGPPEEM